MSESLDRIRRASTMEDIHSIIAVTTALLQASQRHDLCASFTRDQEHVVADWQKTRDAVRAPKTAVNGDNLTEENMDVVVDDDQAVKQSTIDCPATSATPDNSPRKQRRKSRFSDLLPTDVKQCVNSKMHCEKPTVRTNDVSS